MKPRLVVLCLVAIGLVIAYVSTKPPAGAEPGVFVDDIPENERVLGEVGARRPLAERKLPGREPAVKPEFSVSVRVNTDTHIGRKGETVQKNQLIFDITADPAYYVESLRLEFWRKWTDPQGKAVRLHPLQDYVNNYIKAGETFTHRIEIVPAEITFFGGDMGTDEDWGARVIWYGRAREKNPDPLPKL